MKILHLNAGNENGGGMFHILSLLKNLNRSEFVLGVFEKGEMLERAKELDIQVELFAQKKKLDLSLLKQIEEYIRLNNIDMIHTHGPRANFYGALLKKKIKVPWIVTVHSDPRDDFMGKGWKGRLYTTINMKVLAYADHCLAISDRFKKILMGLNIPEDKISVILNGIDFHLKPERIYNRKDFGLSKNDFVIIMIARLEAVKGHKIALEALASSLENNKNIQLLLAGDGAEQKKLKEIAVQKGIADNVHFLGHRNDIKELFSIADISMLSSFSESFPLVLLEAARARLPVITTDVGGVRNLVLDSTYGWVVPVGNSSKLAEAIEEAIFFKRIGELRPIGNHLNIHAKNNFSVEQFAENIYNKYLGVLKN
jgi:L-malate glycosyltransferase